MARPTSCQRSRNGNFNITAWRGGIDGFSHTCHRSFHARPTGGGQYDDGDFSTCKVLLISKILVGGDQNRKAVLFGLLQQLTIFQMVPAQLEGRSDLVGGEVFTKRNRRALVEKNAHSSRFEGTGGVLKYGTDLFNCHAREPGNEV